MNRAKVNWQVHIYGKAIPTFAIPGANDPIAEILYNPVTANPIWVTTQNFLRETHRNEAAI